MKLNWGHKIVITFILFFIIMGTLIYKSVKTDFQLVAPNYYEQEVKYQDKIDAINRAKSIDINFVNQITHLSILSEDIPNNGKIFFYCPFDKNADFLLDIELVNGEQRIDIQNIKKGKWEVEIQFKDQDQLYVIREIVLI